MIIIYQQHIFNYLLHKLSSVSLVPIHKPTLEANDAKQEKGGKQMCEKMKIYKQIKRDLKFWFLVQETKRQIVEVKA